MSKAENRMLGTVVGIVAAILATVGVAIFGPRGCTDPTTTRRVLSDQGYTNIEITGYRWFMGSDSDWFVTGFSATNPNGKPVTGAVTNGFFKGATVRFD